MNLARFIRPSSTSPRQDFLPGAFSFQGSFMRADMSKVIVERPRKYKSNDAQAARRRNDFDGPQFLGIRAGYGYRALNENLSPLRRYLRTQVGRPWSTVYSEITSGLDRRNVVQQHVYQHLDDFIATQVQIRGDELIDLRRPLDWRGSNRIRQELYVDPRSGLVRLNKRYSTWTREKAEQSRKRQVEVHSRRRVINDETLLLLLDGLWFEVKMAPLPTVQIVETIVQGRVRRKRVADARFDAVLKTRTRLDQDDADRRNLYGSPSVYAVSKRQLSRKELRAYDLR